MKQLDEEKQNQVIDFIDFLLTKNEDFKLTDIQKSLDDIKSGNVNKIQNTKDLRKQFDELEI